MEFTLNEVYGMTRNLTKLTDKELPVRISYRLLKLLKGCSSEMETLEKARIKLVEKYKDDPKEGDKEGDIKVSDKNKEKFQEEFTTLLNEEVEIDFVPISIEDLGDISLSANDLLPLQKIISEK